MSHRSLIVLPDDSAQPIVDAIDAAKKSLRVKMFVFSDPALLKAVIAAKRRGVDVRIMLNPSRRSDNAQNPRSRKMLKAARVNVQQSNPAFGMPHEKSMIGDGASAFVKSLNWETKNLTETRDYAIVTSHKKEVQEIIECFEQDGKRKPF